MRRQRRSNRPLVSVLIPTRNAVKTIGALLDALLSQRVSFDFEIVAVDSGSNDGTADLLRGRVTRLLEIPAASFNHGLTRNLLMEEARGDLAALLVQDALPASETWLDNLIAPFADDARLAGVFARQLPHPGASRLTRHALSKWKAAQEGPSLSSVQDTETFWSLTPAERFSRSIIDNVCSALRRTVWRQHPFRPAPIAEDLEWGKEVLLAGYRLAYVPQAAVVHSHERSAGYEFRRTYHVHRRLWELFELRTVPTLSALLRSIASTVPEHHRCLRRGEGPPPDRAETLRALALAFVWPLGQYLGGRRTSRK